MRRVVVTGLGTINPAGCDTEQSWKSIISARSFVDKINPDRFDTSDLSTQIAAQVDQSWVDEIVSAKEQRKIDKFISYSIVASEQAMKSSGWQPETEEEQALSGIFIGSGIGGLITIEHNVRTLYEKGPKRISPFFIPASLINLADGNISIKYKLKGPNNAAVTACASGAHAIGDAYNMIKVGMADFMLAGGAEAPICKIGIAGFNACRALATGFNENPKEASRPWDKAREGFVMGEGAGVLALEEYEHAKKRGATIYAEIVGYGLSGDAHHITAPADDGDGGYRAMRMALQSANITPDEISYINAHGTSTPLGDIIEITAIKRLFGGYDINNLAISSIKSSIGHSLGAAGAIEAVMSIRSLQDSIIPPTLNLDDPADEVSGINLVPHKAQEKDMKYVLSNSFGFGGTNASLIFKKYT